jgi:hypothetical protein
VPFTALFIRQRNWTSCQNKQMVAFLRIQLQDGREAFQNLIRNLNVPALLKPGVPGNAHANQLGKLFSSEATRSSSLKRRQTKLFWMQTSTTVL